MSRVKIPLLPPHALRCETCGRMWWRMTSAECQAAFDEHLTTTNCPLGFLYEKAPADPPTPQEHA